MEAEDTDDVDKPCADSAAAAVQEGCADCLEEPAQGCAGISVFVASDGTKRARTRAVPIARCKGL